MSEPTPVPSAIALALDAYADLIALSEEVEDEWTYVMDLSAEWRTRLEAVAEERSGDVLDLASAVAIDLACEEARRIEDPHRAIDWLSTFPQIVLLALGAAT